VKYVNSADEEMLALNGPKLGDTAQLLPGASWNPRTTAVIRAQPFQQTVGSGTFSTDSSASIRLTKYGLNDLQFQSRNAQEGLALFSDMYYDKGWKAFVDGRETPIVRANYVLRAIKVPAGDHKIDFRFEPQSFKTGNTISAIASIALFVLIAGALVYTIRRKDDSGPAAVVKE
jgi:hypothetical protein